MAAILVQNKRAEIVCIFSRRIRYFIFMRLAYPRNNSRIAGTRFDGGLVVRATQKAPLLGEHEFTSFGFTET